MHQSLSRAIGLATFDEVELIDVLVKGGVDFFFARLQVVVQRFDGLQHFSDRHFNFRSNGKINDKFKITVENDLKKTNYCNDNGIRLFRIKYDDMENIEKILQSIIK